MAMHRMTAARKAALKKAQLASARKRRKGGAKRYSTRRGAYARKLDKMSKSKKRSVRAAAWMSRGSGGWDSSLAYKVSKKRGQKAGKLKKKR